MMTSQILKYVDFTKTQKSRYLQNETLFLFQIKKFINWALRAILWQKIIFVAEVTFKQYLSNIGSSIHVKLSNTEVDLKKSVAYKKKRVFQ